MKCQGNLLTHVLDPVVVSLKAVAVTNHGVAQYIYLLPSVIATMDVSPVCHLCLPYLKEIWK